VKALGASGRGSLRRERTSRGGGATLSGGRTERFGFLPYRRVLELPGVKVEPLPDYAARWARIEAMRHQSGYLYPPTKKRWSGDPFTGKWSEVPNSVRPAHLWKFEEVEPSLLGGSHVLTVEGKYAEGRPRYGADAFIVHLLAYLFGVRLQFDGWWFDRRIPTQLGLANDLTETPSQTAADFIEHALATWTQWSDAMRTDFTTLLFVHSRATLYEWPWERLFFEYAVTDALWSIANDLSWLTARHSPPGWKRIPHHQRINVLCVEFELYGNPDLVKEIVDLRNALVHTALWDGSMPGTGGSTRSWLVPGHLRRFNQRLIPAVLGYGNHYTKTNWATLGTCAFDKVP